MYHMQVSYSPFFYTMSLLGRPFSTSRFTKTQSQFQVRQKSIRNPTSQTLGTTSLNLVEIETSQTDIIQIQTNQAKTWHPSLAPGIWQTEKRRQTDSPAHFCPHTVDEIYKEAQLIYIIRRFHTMR